MARLVYFVGAYLFLQSRDKRRCGHLLALAEMAELYLKLAPRTVRPFLEIWTEQVRVLNSHFFGSFSGQSKIKTMI
jgi:hypothetical protein